MGYFAGSDFIVYFWGIMAAHIGNKYWQFRNKHGRDFKYTPELLWEEAVKYFEWIDQNPLLEYKAFPYKGDITKTTLPKMRAMTESGFCLFADIDHKTFDRYEKINDFFPIVTRIKTIIRTSKFEGAAADLLNPNIIARDLGLQDKTQTEHTGEIFVNFPQEPEDTGNEY